MDTRFITLLPAAALALGVSWAAMADPAKPEADPSAPAPVEQNDMKTTGDATVTVGFTPAMKDTIRTYYKGKKGCPRDEASPPAGCIPRRDQSTAPPYGIGKPLPGKIDLKPLPSALAKAMIAPKGYEFGLVDGDAVLLAKSNKRVADTFPVIDPDAP